MHLKRIPPRLGDLEEEVAGAVARAGAIGRLGRERHAELKSAEVDGFPTGVGYLESMATSGNEERAGVFRATGIFEPVAAVADGAQEVGDPRSEVSEENPETEEETNA
jgi:hypothetical protein